MDYSPAGSLCPWDFPGKNTEVGCHFLLQGIFPTQGSLALASGFFFFTTESPRKEAYLNNVDLYFLTWKYTHITEH